jgi:predicted O-linked N-acetylglucosamine transferase (SPINDLY family)
MRQRHLSKKASVLAPTVEFDLLQKALALHQSGLLQEARQIYTEILKKNKNQFDALNLSGLIEFEHRNFLEAAQLFTSAITVKSTSASTHSNLGLALKELGELELAVKCFDKAISIDASYAEAFYNRGIALHDMEKFDLAIESYSNAIDLNANFAESYNNKGLSHKAIKQLTQARDCYLQAIQISPNYAEALNNLGVVHKELGNPKEAVACCQKAIELVSNFAEAHYNLGLAWQELKEFDKAVASYGQAVNFNDALPEAHYNRGVALHELKQFKAAVISYESAIRNRSNYKEAYNNLGVSLKELKQYRDAQVCYETALALDVNFVDAHYNLANVLQLVNGLEAALLHYRNAFSINPEYLFLYGTFLLLEMQLCDWESLSSDLLKLEQEILKRKKVTDPFPALVLFDDPKLHQIAAQVYVDDKAPLNPILGDIAPRPPHRRIRLGFYSADLRWHPVAIWLAEQVENHDKSKFELFAFSFRSDVKDPMQQRLQAAFDHFIEVDSMSDLELAKLSRELEIDIALDLGGHTQDSRPGVFAARAAPIQVSHLGFPGSWGADYIDYILANVFGVQQEMQQHFNERIIYVPALYTYDRQRAISTETLKRAAFGLPDTGFVFTCQNGIQKIHPEVFDIWMRLLNNVPGSVLWLQEPHPTAIRNLQKEAQARGVNPARLVFLKREVVAVEQEPARIAKYLASYRLADLFLDTWPYNAGTTAIDALWAGLPVITKSGKSLVSRMATSALHDIEMPELITSTAQDYEALALELATNTSKLQAVKDKLASHRLTTALFDPVANTRHIENAYVSMVQMLNED